MQKALLGANLEKLAVEKEVVVTIPEEEALELPIKNIADAAVCSVQNLDRKILYKALQTMSINATCQTATKTTSRR